MEPIELSSHFPSTVKKEVRAYMLAQQHFIEALSEILDDKENCGNSTHEDMYNKILGYCANRSALAAKWHFLHRNPGLH
ncbi:hypothetical protein [Spirosoma foliorum]|uniref:Uncharacterized protein n=1 Tax=Spirosoma foliorum TaxID=2710596 RepID=A0A7G5GS45_9BACT|nr:hypothetical protein [Spirosoma foliorum]QMW01687.1 hypothetical protein H3H32_27605 [Spirosoma foliorum]